MDLLKASILKAQEGDLLTYYYDNSDESTKQLIPQSYFENIEDLLSIDDCWLINPKSILHYQKRACYYTKKVISEFLKNTDDEAVNNSLL